MSSAISSDPHLIHPELFTSIAKGDRRALGRLYDRSAPLLFTLAMRILADRQEATALLQDVYTEIWRKTVRYDERRSSPMAWLVGLTRSRAIDRLRTHAARRDAATKGDDTGDDCRDARQHDSVPDSVDADIRDMVAQALADLPAPQRDALELAYYEGLSQSEIAQRLNEPVATITTRLKVSITNLRTRFKAAMETGLIP